MYQNKEMSKQFFNLLTKLGYTLRSYSGRGMYGAKCISLSTDSKILHKVVSIMNDVFNEGDDEAFSFSAEVLQHTATDSIGLDMIIYWPALIWLDKFDGKEE